MPAINADLKLEIKGMKEFQRYCENVVKDMQGAPMLDGLRKATLIVQRDAKILSPVDTGRLRASITPEIRQIGKETQGIIGSNVVYAPYMELGTGVYAGGKPYFPPPEALATWAKRHGSTGYLVALAIFKAGGLKPRKFFQRAIDQNYERIMALIGQAVEDIIKK